MSKHGSPAKHRNPGITGGATEKIGNVGDTKGEKGTAGGQLPFLPNPEAYSGRKPQKVSSGQGSGTTTGNLYPFLPTKPGKK